MENEDAMAAIDKIYGTKEQRDEFFSSCEKNKPDALLYFYQWWKEWNDGEENPITNFPETIDKWLLENCKISWVVAYIKDQYGE